MVFAVLVSRGRYDVAMWLIVVPAVVRLLMAPPDDVWTGVLVFLGMGAALISLFWDMDDAVGGRDDGIGWGLWMSLGAATVIGGAEVWRWIRRR